MIHQADGQLADLILASISSRPERNIYSKRCGGSGVKLLRILSTRNATTYLNSGSQSLIVDEIANLSARGFELATTVSFADYRERIGALNNSLSAKLRSNEDSLNG